MIAAGIVMVVVAVCIDSDKIGLGGLVMIIASAIFLACEEGTR